MVKNKDLPDSAAPPVWSFSLSLSLSLPSPSQTWPYQGWSHVSSLADAFHPEGTPWILLRLDPGTISSLTTSNLLCFMNIPDSYAVLFFTALNFTFIIRHIHNWVVFFFFSTLAQPLHYFKLFMGFSR